MDFTIGNPSSLVIILSIPEIIEPSLLLKTTSVIPSFATENLIPPQTFLKDIELELDLATLMNRSSSKEPAFATCSDGRIVVIEAPLQEVDSLYGYTAQYVDDPFISIFSEEMNVVLDALASLVETNLYPPFVPLSTNKLISSPLVQTIELSL